MSLMNWFTENIILPSSDLILGQSIYTDLKFLEKSQWWSAEKMEQYQNERLRLLIWHAYNHTEYYKELFDGLKLSPNDIQTKEDLKKLPILTKEVLKENIKNKKIIAKNIPLKKMIASGSSGSTGEPLQYFRTRKAYSMNQAAAIRSWYWMGFRLGDKYVKLSQNPRNKFIKKVQDKLNRTLYLYSQQLTETNFIQKIKKISQFNPKVIRGYPDPMLFLANFMKRNAIQINAPSAIATTGNILHPSYREIIEQQFGCKIFDSYSCEGTANVAECANHECYHSSMEYAITEILQNHVEVGAGEQGRIISTDLVNYAVPFIRYDTQDYVVKADKACSCGRHLLAIKEIKGRDSDILISPSGKYLIVHNFTPYFGKLKEIDQFQILQRESDEIDIVLKVNKSFTDAMKNDIKQYWEQYIGSDVKVKIVIVDDIPVGKNGKRRFLIRNQNIKLDF